MRTGLCDMGREEVDAAGSG